MDEAGYRYLADRRDDLTVGGGVEADRPLALDERTRFLFICPARDKRPRSVYGAPNPVRDHAGKVRMPRIAQRNVT